MRSGAFRQGNHGSSAVGREPATRQLVLCTRAWPAFIRNNRRRIDDRAERGTVSRSKNGRRSAAVALITAKVSNPLIAERASERASGRASERAGERVIDLRFWRRVSFVRSFVRAFRPASFMSPPGRCASGRRNVLSFVRRGPPSASFFLRGRQVASTTRDIILVVGLWLPSVMRGLPVANANGKRMLKRKGKREREGEIREHMVRRAGNFER